MASPHLHTSGDNRLTTTPIPHSDLSLPCKGKGHGPCPTGVCYKGLKQALQGSWLPSWPLPEGAGRVSACLGAPRASGGLSRSWGDRSRLSAGCPRPLGPSAAPGAPAPPPPPAEGPGASGSATGLLPVSVLSAGPPRAGGLAPRARHARGRGGSPVCVGSAPTQHPHPRRPSLLGPSEALRCSS